MKYQNKYYLETNALYQLKKFSSETQESSFTSALAITELVAGVTEYDFKRRSAIAQILMASDVAIDWRFPEEIQLESFDCALLDEFEDIRKASLQVLFIALSEAKSFTQFKTIDNKVDKEFNLSFFKRLDDTWAERFVNVLNDSNFQIAEAIEKFPNEKLEFNGKIYNVGSRKGLNVLFVEQPSFNWAISIYGMIAQLRRSKVDIFNHLTDEMIYESYNGLSDHFVRGFSAYSSEKLVNMGSASKNDLLDLYHLTYLRDCKRTFIVSEDKIYQRLGLPNVVTSESLIGI